MKIEHEATDKKLAAQIAEYNNGLAQHEEAEAALAKPFSIPDDEMAEITMEDIETQREGILSERLKLKQDAVRLARERIEILEAMQAELDQRATEAEKAHTDCVKKTAKKLTSSGAGVESQQAALSGHMDLAERQFSAAVQRAVPVKEAKESAMVAERQKNENPKRIRQSKEALADSVSDLRRFIQSEIDHGGEVNKHGYETKKRTYFDRPVFSGQRVSAR